MSSNAPKRYPFSDFVNVTPVNSRKSQSGRELQTFQSGRLWLPTGARGVFGGQVIAQALMSASATVQLPLGLHSQHCYFLLPADASIPINYEVERLRDGKSYATRLVKAIQRDKPVFILAASYTLPPITLPKCPKKPDPAAAAKEAVSHSLRFALGNASESGPAQEAKAKKRRETDDIQSPFGFTPKFQLDFPEEVMSYEECEQEENRWLKFLGDKKDLDKRGQRAIEEYIKLKTKERQESPVAIAVAKVKQTRDEVIAAGGNNRMIWMKARLQPEEKPSEETVKAMIAYISDFQFIGTASRAVGLTRVSTPKLGMLASLDHSTHFYPLPPNFDPASPMLHVMEGIITDVASGRGVVRGLIYTQDGILIATTLQEGVVRADTRGKKAKGLVEGRGLGEEREADGSVKAKL